jgi:DNA-binding PadR family transcriptional regulator
MSPRPQLPHPTHLQFLVLDVLVEGGRHGREIRRDLGRHGVRRSGPAFYQMMARLEDAGWVEGFYDQKLVGSQLIKERCYRLTAAGGRVWQETRDFYAETLARRGRRAGIAHA